MRPLLSSGRRQANFPDLPAEDVLPLRDLDAAETPFRGNSVPAAKACVAKLRGLITSLLASERQSASAILDEHEAKLRALPDFLKLKEGDAALVLEKTTETRKEVSTARFVSAIRDRLNRYRTQDYPAQLDLAVRLATPASPKSGSPTPQASTYVPAASLRPKCDLPFIASEQDLDLWLAALRATASEELQKGNRISL